MLPSLVTATSIASSRRAPGIGAACSVRGRSTGLLLACGLGPFTMKIISRTSSTLRNAQKSIPLRKCEGRGRGFGDIGLGGAPQPGDPTGLYAAEHA